MNARWLERQRKDEIVPAEADLDPDNVVVASLEEAAVRRYWQDVWTERVLDQRAQRCAAPGIRMRDTVAGNHELLLGASERR